MHLPSKSVMRASTFVDVVGLKSGARRRVSSSMSAVDSFRRNSIVPLAALAPAPADIVKCYNQVNRNAAPAVSRRVVPGFDLPALGGTPLSRSGERNRVGYG